MIHDRSAATSPSLSPNRKFDQQTLYIQQTLRRLSLCHEKEAPLKDRDRQSSIKMPLFRVIIDAAWKIMSFTSANNTAPLQDDSGDVQKPETDLDDGYIQSVENVLVRVRGSSRNSVCVQLYLDSQFMPASLDTSQSGVNYFQVIVQSLDSLQTPNAKMLYVSEVSFSKGVCTGSVLLVHGNSKTRSVCYTQDSRYRCQEQPEFQNSDIMIKESLNALRQNHPRTDQWIGLCKAVTAVLVLGACPYTAWSDRPSGSI